MAGPQPGKEDVTAVWQLEREKKLPSFGNATNTEAKNSCQPIYQESVKQSKGASKVTHIPRSYQIISTITTIYVNEWDTALPLLKESRSW